MQKKLGKLIRKLRNDQNLTIKELNKKIGKNLSNSYMSKVELYGEIPSKEVICLLAEAFKIDKEILLDIARQEKLDKYKEHLKNWYTG